MSFKNSIILLSTAYCLLLQGCSQKKSDSDIKQQTTNISSISANNDTTANIYPPSIGKLKSVELGQAVLMFMPPSDGTKLISWAFQSDNGVVWLDDSYKSAADGSNYRTGLMRINVDGVKSTILKKEIAELAWSVTYTGSSNPNFGVDTITLEPGIDDGDQCFGSITENCTFNPLMSLAKANITVDVLCKTEQVDGTIVGLSLSENGKKSIQAIWLTSGGSGGQASSIKLLVNQSKNDVCKDSH